MTIPMGRAMRSQFFFPPEYTPLNHGSFGTYPKPVKEALNHYQILAENRPDTFIRSTYPALLNESRSQVAALLRVPVEEVVLVQNVTIGINTVLRALVWEPGDVILYFETVYGAIEKTIEYICEMTPAQAERIEAHYPISDQALVKLFVEKVVQVQERGQKVKMAIFDTVSSIPGVAVPWIRLVQECKDRGIYSMVDGAHGIGLLDLDLGKVQPDFFVSNLHKWLFVPRGCCVFHVPLRNQHLIRSSLPTSHAFIPLPRPPPSHQHTINNPMPPSSPSLSPFEALFEFVGTIDNANYLCVPAALKFRTEICGGEAAIREYCVELAREGGLRAARILGTEVMENEAGSLTSETAFCNVRLPLVIGEGKGEVDGDGKVKKEDASAVAAYIGRRLMNEFDTFIGIILYRGNWWARFSAQVYLEVGDFEWGAGVLLGLCGDVRKGGYLKEGREKEKMNGKTVVDGGN